MFALAKRVFLFICVNIAVTATLWAVLTVAASFFPELRRLDITGTVIMGGLFGFGGAFFSLAVSKWMAKRGLGVQVIDPASATGEAHWLVQTVHKLAKQAGIETMPEVGIWDSPETNAFCTGPSKNNSLVAVSTGILRTMSHDELEGVLGHELSHATNGDMVTMTLIQGVVNSFVFVIAILVSRFVSNSRDDNGRGMGGYFMQHMIFNLVQFVVGLLAFAVIIGPFSRWREYRADAGGALLTSKAKMIAGLQALMDKQRIPLPPEGPRDPALATLMVNGGGSWMATHPSLEDRIARLKEMVILR